MSHDFEQIFWQIVSYLRVKTLSNTDLVASRRIKSDKGSLPIELRRSKTSRNYSLRGRRKKRRGEGEREKERERLL